MPAAPLLSNEKARLAALHQCRIMDTPPEAIFDELTRYAQDVCGVPMALIGLIDHRRQWFKSRVGLSATEAPREDSFCAHALLSSDQALIVPNTLADTRFANHPSVTGHPHIRFYAGFLLRSPEGYALGTLCVMDRIPRQLSAVQFDQLNSLAQQTAFQLALRRRVPTERRLTLGFAVIFVLLAAIMCFSLWQAHSFLASDHWVEHTNRVIRVIEEVLSDVQAAESSQRGYTASGQETYLPSYQAAADLLPPRLNALRDLVHDNPAQLRRTDRLAALTRKKMAVTRERIEQRRVLGIAALDPAYLNGSGRQAMAEVLAMGHEMIGVENALLQERSVARGEELRAAEAALLGTGMLCLCLLAGGFVLNRRELRHRQALSGSLAQANADLAGTNRQMEARVQARTVELAQSLERLRASEGRLHAVLNAAPVVLFAADAAGVLTFSEGRELAALGLQPGELVGRSIAEIHGEGSEVFKGCRQALAGDEVEVETVFAGVTIDIRFSPTREPDGAITGVTGIAVDVTAAKQAREHLRRAKEEAERANNAKSEFLSRMSHELRTPLNAVLGFTQLLEIGVTSPQDVESVEQILKAGRHLLALIDEVLDISRIETGAIHLTLEPLSVKEMMRAALQLLEPAARTRRIGLEIATDFPDVQVLADEVRLRQCLLNLLSNAVKFNREEGAVHVSCEYRADKVRLMVSDTGSGISEGDQAKLFVPFERLDANERNIEGSGIGLALCKRLIESQGGRIGVDSTPGQGSTFWIELPAVTAVAVSPRLPLDALFAGEQASASHLAVLASLTDSI